MLTTLIFNIIAVFFAWLESNKSSKHGLNLSVFTIFIFLALRFDFGNDYMTYLEVFQNINKFELPKIDSFTLRGNEIGWFYLNRLFKPLGFFSMTIILAAFNCFVIYRFIKKHVPTKYYWFAILLYTFQTAQMLILSSAMRQAIAVSIFIMAIDFIIQKKVIQYIILILIATLFHSSAGFLFPVIVLGFINIKMNYIHILWVILAFIIPFFFLEKVFESINNITSLYFETYTYYIENVISVSTSEIGIGFFLNIIIYLVIIYYSKFEVNIEKRVFYKIAILSFLLIPLSFSVQLIGRLSFYFYPVLMIVFPLIFSKMKTINRYLYMGLVLLFTFYNFFQFFNEGVYKIPFSTYKTIFSAPHWL